MKVFLATNYRIAYIDGKYYAKAKFSSIIFRYYEAFGKLTLCSRLDHNAKYDNNLIDISKCIEKYIKIESLLMLYLFKYDKIIKENLKNVDLIIARCPSGVAFKVLSLSKSKYLAEVMGCPWDAYWNHGLLGKILAPYMYLKMKRTLKKADYALYVTEEFLQHRYPCKCESISASNVNITDINEDVLKKKIEKIQNKELKTSLNLMTSAAIDVPYKGQKYVIKAIKILEEKGINVDYYLAGGGSKERLYNIAKQQGVADKVHFLGEISNSEILSYLDKTDIYIQPSLQEGLPRAVIEAMSRGCAVIGSKTAGIPELIQESMLVKRKSVSDIVEKINYYYQLNTNDKESLTRENFEKSKNYENSILDIKRKKYFNYIKNNIKKEDKR